MTALPLGRKTVSFWEAQFLPKWFPLLLGSVLGLLLALLIAKEAWFFAVLVVLAVPAIVLLNRYPFMAVMVWMLLLPYFMVTPEFTGRTLYWMLHRALVPTALGLVLLSSAAGLRKKATVRLGRAELATLIFLGLLVINLLLFSEQPRARITAYDNIFIPLCMYWLIRLTAPKEKDLKYFLWAAGATLIIQAAIGITGWFAPEILPPQWVRSEEIRTQGSLGAAASYTSTILFCALLLLHYALQCAGSRLRILLLGLFGLALYCIFMGFSRGSWLGAGSVLAILIFLHPKTMIRLVVVLGIVAFVLSGSLLAGQIAWGYERLTGEEGRNSAESRMTANVASIGMLKTKPFLGWGYDNYDQFKRPFMDRIGNFRLYERSTSHNTYLTLMVEFGVIGFFFYFFPLVWWLILSPKAWQHLPRRGFWSQSLLLMFWLAMLHICIVGNFMDILRNKSFLVTLWWMIPAFIANMVDQSILPGDIGAPRWVREAIRRP
jgi:O-antigen ligase